MTNTLHIFALNEPVTTTHTNLTRQTEEAPILPPLAEWLGVDALDTDDIEMFSIDTLGGMALSDYVTMAFAPDPDLSRMQRARLDALGGTVLLVPDKALTGAPVTGPEATAITSVPLARANHDAAMPKADIAPKPAKTPLPAERETVPPIAFFALLGIAVLAAIIVLVGWN